MLIWTEKNAYSYWINQTNIIANKSLYIRSSGIPVSTVISERKVNTKSKNGKVHFVPAVTSSTHVKRVFAAKR